MKTFAERAFNLRREEALPACILFCYLFLVIGAYVAGQSIGDALFLSVLREWLPHAIMATGVIVGVFVAVYIRLSRRLSLQRLICGCLLFFALAFAGAWWLTGSRKVTGSPLLTAALYSAIFLLVYAAGALAPTMGWTLANFMLTTREARRVFGFIGGGAILGSIAAGFLTRAAGSMPVRPEALLLVVAGAFLLSALLVAFVFRRENARLSEARAGSFSLQDAPRSFLESARVLSRSRYLLLIAALIFASCLVTTIVGYQFKMIAAARFNTIELVRFFGSFYGWMGLASLALQLIVTGRLLHSFGIRVTLFILPVLFLFGTGFLLLLPSLLAVSVLKGGHTLLRYSLDKASVEMLYLPVGSEEKNQVKAFIDNFVWRMADTIAGVALWFFSKVAGFTPSRMGWVNLVLIGCWILVASRVRHEYVSVLRHAIQRQTLDPKRTSAAILDATTASALVLQLQAGDEEQILYRLSLFEIGAETPPRAVLRQLLEHERPAVRAQALRLLGDNADTSIVEHAEKLLADSSPAVRAEAGRYLAIHAGRDPLTLVENMRGVPAYHTQAAVATFLLSSQDVASATWILKSMIADNGPERSRSRAEAARVLALAPPAAEVHSALFDLLQDSDPQVVEQALVTAGKVGARKFLPLVIEKLGDRRLMLAARVVLLQFGDRAVGTLQDYLNDAAVPAAVRSHIPAVLAGIGTPQASQVLFGSLIQSEPGLRFNVIKALNRLKSQGKLPVDAQICEEVIQAEMIGFSRSFQILGALETHELCSDEPLVIRALRERMEFELERIFRLLALIYPARDMHSAYLGLRSGNARVQANALEVIEHIVKPDLYRPLSCLLDPEIGMAGKILYAGHLCGVEIESKAEALRILIHSQDAWLAACAIYALGQLRLGTLDAEVRELPASADPVLEETRKWTIARMARATAAARP